LVLRSFRQLSRSYFASEKGWEFVIEALLFAILLAISTWPIFAAVEAVNKLLQRTVQISPCSDLLPQESERLNSFAV